jgi:hypothetical protein
MILSQNNDSKKCDHQSITTGFHQLYRKYYSEIIIELMKNLDKQSGYE